MEMLKDYQKNAVKKICDFFCSDINKAQMCIATGLGKTAIIVTAVNRISCKYENISIAILTSYRIICEQILRELSKINSDFKVAMHVQELAEENILITTYQDAEKNHLKFAQFDMIICDMEQKYLFPAALRNVAFIISRNGFDENAQKAAIGSLKENGKLIISLTDKDLLAMIEMKENGGEPSDYLLDKVEDVLMSVGK